MAVTTDTVLADALDRVRDPNATMVATNTPPTTASGKTFGFAMMTAAQLFVSLAERLLTNESGILLAINTALYDIPSNIADYGGKVISCRVAGDKVIDGPVDFRALGRNSFTWLKDVDSSAFGWSPIGTDKLAVVPVFASLPPTVLVTYYTFPGVLTTGIDISIPDDTAEHLARMLELIFLLKGRQLNSFQDKLQTLFQAMGASDMLRAPDALAPDMREDPNSTSGGEAA